MCKNVAHYKPNKLDDILMLLAENRRSIGGNGHFAAALI